MKGKPNSGLLLNANRRKLFSMWWGVDEKDIKTLADIGDEIEVTVVRTDTYRMSKVFFNQLEKSRRRAASNGHK